MKQLLSYFIMLCCAVFIFSHSVYSQTLSFQSFTSAQGLSQNSIYSIAETEDGFMWFGTQDGLNRFDGKNFIQIRGKKADSAKTSEEATGFSKMITALCADSNWLWVGTTYEFIMYDCFTNRFLKPGAVCKGFNLPENIWVIKVVKDNANNIWVLTRNKGLFCYSKSLQKMISFNWNGARPNIISLSWEDNGQLWACSESGIYRAATGGYFEAIDTKLFLQHPAVGIADMQVVKNRIWLITNKGTIQILSKRNDSLDNVTLFENEFTGKKYLTDARLLHQSDSNTIWIGSRSDGLIKVNLSAKTFENASAYQNENALQRQFILSFFTSSQKIIWIGTSGGGISKYDAAKPQFGLWRAGFFNKNNKVNDNMILSIFSNNGDDFYMGTMVNGLIHFNEEKSIWNYYLPQELNKNPAAKNIYTIASGVNNTLWLATWGGLYNFNKQNSKFTLFHNVQDEQTIELTVVAKLKLENKLLTGGYRGSFRLFNLLSKQFELPKDVQHILDSLKLRIRYMKEMEQGDIYMGTEAQGFVKYNYLSGFFTFFPQFTKISNDCRHFCFSNGNVWIATTNGIIQVDSATMSIKKIWNINDGLPNNYIYAVETDNNGMVWASSNAGICSINPITGICHKYKEENGLQGMEYNTAAVHKTNKNEIWFGGINGLNHIKIMPVKELYITPPPPLLTNIKIMNVEYVSDTATPYLHLITLPHNKNFVSFEFQAPIFSQTENVTYEYKLTGVDTGWVNIGSKNFANYSQLKPGHYSFYIRCANASLIWSKTSKAITIMIVPPWYGTWWFRLLALLSVILLTGFAVRLRIKTIQHNSLSRQKIAETEMAALKAQMNPHFIFNCINSIDAFIQSNDKYNATRYLNKFAKLIRNVLDSSKENVVLFSKDIDTLKLYTELEQLRSDYSFKVNFEIDNELLNSDYKVPPLIVQPFIENAIIHGLRNKETKDGFLQIKIAQKENKINYLIRDNGIGRKAAETINAGKEKSYGMQMSHDRVMLFNKEKEPSITITDLYENDKPVGTEVSVYINII